MSRYGRRLTAIVSALIALSAPAAVSGAAGVPPDGVLAFAVERNGTAIGRHELRFEHTDGTLAVAAVADIVYRIAFVPVYRFHHTAREVWQEGRLQMLQATTNDNGERFEVVVEPVQNGLTLSVNGESRPLDPLIVPASLWNRAIVERAAILDPADGDLMQVQGRFVGEETVEVRGEPTYARRFALEGEFERELWYDRNDVLVKVRFSASDGSEIHYRLQPAPVDGTVGAR